jgi:gamma-glutamylcyclotransferase (GGCT)/AIG2-like uncharacterized protein YtfP
VTAEEANIALFSYGTLQQPEVQIANYGRLLRGEPDRLAGYLLARITITDPNVVALSGKSAHQIARFTGNATDLIDGMVLMLMPSELAATDAYETDDYRRVELTLQSGRTAFVYVEANPT